MDQIKLGFILIFITLGSPILALFAIKYVKHQRTLTYVLLLAAAIPFLSIAIAFFYPWLTKVSINILQWNAIPRQSLAKVMTGFGLWLSSASIIGRSRLENWDASFRKNLSEMKFEEKLMKLIAPLPAFTIWLIKALWILSALLITILLPAHYLIPQNILDQYFLPVLGVAIFSLFSIPFLFLLSGLLTTIPYLILIPLFWLILLPYKLTSYIEQRDSLDRAFLLLGLIFGTIGLMLS